MSICFWISRAAISGIPKDILAKKRATWADMQDDKSTACPTTLAALTEVESTLASEVASTVGCSTLGADEGGSDKGEVSDIETESSTISRMSKSRPAKMRSENRKARRREAHIARAVAKNAAQGNQFVPVSHEEHRAQQRSNMVVPSDQSAPGIINGERSDRTEH